MSNSHVELGFEDILTPEIGTGINGIPDPLRPPLLARSSASATAHISGLICLASCPSKGAWACVVYRYFVFLLRLKTTLIRARSVGVCGLHATGALANPPCSRGRRCRNADVASVPVKPLSHPLPTQNLVGGLHGRIQAIMLGGASGAARGEGGKLPPNGWTSKNYVICVCAFIVMELLRITRQIHRKAVEQRATLLHRQYNRDWGTSYSRPPIDPYLTSPCYKILAALLGGAKLPVLGQRRGPQGRSSRPKMPRAGGVFGEKAASPILTSYRSTGAL